MKPNKFLLLLLIALGLLSQRQKVPAQSLQNKYAFGLHETLEFTVSYHWGLIWIDAGIVDFKVSEEKHQSEKAFYFLSTGRSFRKFDWLFRVRDTFEAVTYQKDLSPVWFRRHTHEGGYFILNEYTFDHQKRIVTGKNSETGKGSFLDTIPFPKNSYDVLTATYAARSLDFGKLKPSDTLQMQMILDGKVFTLPIVYQGKEVIKNRDGIRYNCIKFSAILDRGTMFKAGEQLIVWVSDDKNKVPVMMEAKIRVGSIKIHLSGHENLRHPLTSLIK